MSNAQKLMFESPLQKCMVRLNTWNPCQQTPMIYLFNLDFSLDSFSLTFTFLFFNHLDTFTQKKIPFFLEVYKSWKIYSWPSFNVYFQNYIIYSHQPLLENVNKSTIYEILSTLKSTYLLKSEQTLEWAAVESGLAEPMGQVGQLPYKFLWTLL